MIDLSKSIDEVFEILKKFNSRFPDNQVDIEQVWEMTQSGEAQVFPLASSVIACRTYANGEVYIIAAAGLLKELVEFEPELVDWYRQRGYVSMIAKGRHGWRKSLSKLGWYAFGPKGTLRKDLQSGC